jgi:hypothetical protein
MAKKREINEIASLAGVSPEGLMFVLAGLVLDAIGAAFALIWAKSRDRTDP